jgi:hypothetical protein
MFPANEIRISLQERTELSDEELRVGAPSIFASHPGADVSPRYAFVPTSQLISHLREAGWSPVSVTQQRIRVEGRRGFQKHLVRFQRRDVVPVKGEYTPELCLLNSHDGTSAYRLHAGLFRFICANGMHVSDGEIAKVTIRHTGFTPDEAIEASFRILNQVPAITERVEKLRSRLLSHAQAQAFASAALRLRYPNPEIAPIGSGKLLEVRRSEDAGSSLWTVFNRVQEALVRGGLSDDSRRRQNGRPFARMRAITGLDSNLRLNRDLWKLAQHVADDELVITC